MARYTIHIPEGPKRKTLYGQTRAEVSAKLTKAMADRDGGLLSSTPETLGWGSTWTGGSTTRSGIR
jgi:hypothetical protein